MGWISEALKKAEEERAATLGTSSASTAVMDPAAETIPHRQSDASPSSQADDTPSPSDAAKVRSLVAACDPSLVAVLGRDPVLVEQYRALRTRLLSRNTRGLHQTLVITSSLAGDGKSVTTANLGAVFAEVRHLRVLLVDADFRRSRLPSLFGLQTQPGLTEVLLGQADIEQVIQQTPIGNLHLIAAGNTRGVNPAEILSSRRAVAVFDELRDQYGYVLIDTPPCGDVADAGIIGQYTNGVLLVVRAGVTPQPVAQRVVQMLQASQVNIIGCVLAGSDETSSTYRYDDYSNGGQDDQG